MPVTPPPPQPQQTVTVVPYDPSWPELFNDLGLRIRGALDTTALRIDHIGSTSVPGLAAKPIIDIQISVADFEPLVAFKDPLHELGFAYRKDNPELTKRYFRERPGTRRTHVHVRRAGSFSEQFALLFRDYLRIDNGMAGEYAALKERLAARFRDDRHAYTDGKGPFSWQVIRRADEWAQRAGWSPGPSDA